MLSYFNQHSISVNLILIVFLSLFLIVSCAESAEEAQLPPCAEEAQLTPFDEEAQLPGGAEKAKPPPYSEEAKLSGSAEEAQLTPFDLEKPPPYYEEAQLPGGAEEAKLSGSDEEAKLSGSDEEAQLPGGDEEAQLPGGDEEAKLSGSAEEAKLSGSDSGSKISLGIVFLFFLQTAATVISFAITNLLIYILQSATVSTLFGLFLFEWLCKVMRTPISNSVLAGLTMFFFSAILSMEWGLLNHSVISNVFLSITVVSLLFIQVIKFKRSSIIAQGCPLNEKKLEVLVMCRSGIISALFFSIWYFLAWSRMVNQSIWLVGNSLASIVSLVQFVVFLRSKFCVR